MHISLNGTWRRALFSLVVLALLGVYVEAAVRSYMAYRAANRADEAGLRRAIQLEPRNSDYHYRLGLHSFFVQQDPGAALEHYRHSIALNPHMAKYWLDMAEAQSLTGDAAAETAAIEQAIRMEPTRPAIAWEAGNLYFVQGNTPKALQLMRVAISNDQQSYASHVIDLTWRATHDPDLIVREVLPANPDVYLAFIQMLTRDERTDDAEKVWKHLVVLGKPFDPRNVFAYFDYEINHRRSDAAGRIWEHLLNVHSTLAADAAADSLAFNGGFDRDLMNGGFDWRFSAQPHVTHDLDNNEFHGGNRSLLLSYDGEPSGDSGVYQLIRVEPNTPYKFSAYEKTYELLTASGPRFHIFDPYTGERLLMTADVLGSTVWSQVSGEFTTGPQTRLVKLAIVREPAHHRIVGKFWVDDVTLRRK